MMICFGQAHQMDEKSNGGKTPQGNHGEPSSSLIYP